MKFSKPAVFVFGLVAVIAVIALASALYTLAASPSASPRIVTDTNSTASENVTSALAASQQIPLQPPAKPLGNLSYQAPPL